MTPRARLLWLTLFAIAMALFEAVLVIHLRGLYYPDDPLSLFPLVPLSDRDLALELGRETATLLMLLAVAKLTERGWLRVFAAFVYLFGLWDIFYYVWLKLLIGWPTQWGEWDVLFLIPWPWLGPWIAPALIALLFVIWGGWILLSSRTRYVSALSISAFVAGSALGLTAFLLPAYPLLAGGKAAVAAFMPQTFPWGFYHVGFGLMAVGLWLAARQHAE